MKKQSWTSYLIVAVPILLGVYSFFHDMNYYDAHPEFSGPKTMMYIKLVGFLVLAFILYKLVFNPKEDEK